MATSDYRFIQVTSADLPLLRNWLSDSEVRRWWGDPDEEIALIAGDLENSSIALNIVWFGAKPFAYIQDYDVHASPEKHRHHLPEGTRSIDVFVGEADMRGKGHGPKFLRLRAMDLKQSGAPVVVIDPLVANLNARNAYKKAGFIGDDAIDSDDGPIVVMTFIG